MASRPKRRAVGRGASRPLDAPIPRPEEEAEDEVEDEDEDGEDSDEEEDEDDEVVDEVRSRRSPSVVYTRGRAFWVRQARERVRCLGSWLPGPYLRVCELNFEMMRGWYSGSTSVSSTLRPQKLFSKVPRPPGRPRSRASPRRENPAQHRFP